MRLKSGVDTGGRWRWMAGVVEANDGCTIMVRYGSFTCAVHRDVAAKYLRVVGRLTGSKAQK